MAKINKYQQGKERARETAINWQYDTANISLSWEGVALASAYLGKLAKRYGLVREFRENAII